MYTAPAVPAAQPQATNPSTISTSPSNEPLVHIEGEKGGMNIGMVLFLSQ